MRTWRHILAGASLLALFSGVLGILVPTPVQAAPSQKVAFVPSDDGQEGNGGTLPTGAFPNGYSATFSNVSLASIESGATDPLPAFDTVVLVQVCDIGTYLANTQFSTRLESFVSNGGKLLIWDSECEATNYADFIFPFSTSNPGAAGETGTLTISENNALANSSPASAQYVDVNLISTDTDAVGDANVFVTKDVNWCVSMTGTNTLGVNGPVVNYARSGSGLIVYTGLDMDDLYDPMAFDPTSTDGPEQLGRVWLNQLLVDASSNLPCGVLAYGLTLTPPTATLPVGTTHTVTATMFSNGAPVPNVPVTFTVSGANAGATGVVTTDASGVATFTYTGAKAGDDTITATAATPGAPTATKTASVTWTASTTTAPPAAAQAVQATPAFTG